jgi:hypothetical protein
MKRIRDYFFAEEVPYALALLRMTLPLVLVTPILQRWPHVRELFSTDGAAAPLWVGFGHPNLLPVPSPTVAVSLYAILTFTLFTSIVGWMTRTSLALTCVLYTYFTMLDAISTMTKYGVISSHVLLLLTVSGSGAVWSVDSWLKRRAAAEAGEPEPSRLAPVWPRRLISILLGVVYLGAAATKMHTTGYFSGDQMAYWMLTNLNFNNPIGEWLSLFPAFLVVSSYLVIFWEMTFLLACWQGWTRTVWLAFGYLFHLMTALLLGLIIFPIVYVTLYWSLFSEAEILRGVEIARRLGDRLRISSWVSGWRLAQWRPRWRIGLAQSVTAYGVLAAVGVMASVEVEYRSDVYGERRPEGRYVLQPIDPDQLSTLLNEAQALDPADKMFGFDIGTELLGDVLMDRRREFTQGEQAIVQCSLEPQHEDLYVDVQIRDEDERILQRGGIVVPRENLRSNLFYKLDGTFEPGKYTFVLRIDGQEVARKQVVLNAAG